MTFAEAFVQQEQASPVLEHGTRVSLMNLFVTNNRSPESYLGEIRSVRKETRTFSDPRVQASVAKYSSVPRRSSAVSEPDVTEWTYPARA